MTQPAAYEPVHAAHRRTIDDDGAMRDEVEPIVDDWLSRLLAAQRRITLTGGLIAIVLGLVVIIRPAAGVLTLGTVFGVYLVFAGTDRLSRGVIDHHRSIGWRWFDGILGALVMLAGVYCLLNLFDSAQVLGIVFAIGLLLIGVATLMPGAADSVSGPTWLRVVTGIVTLIAGVLVLVVPLVSLGVLVWLGGFALILIGVALLTSLLAPERDR